MKRFQQFRLFQELYEFYNLAYACCGIRSFFLKFCIDYFVRLPLKRNHFFADFQQLVNDYDAIAIHRLHYVTRIGEMVPRLLNAKSDMETNRKNRILDLVFVGSYPIKERKKNVQNELGLKVLAPNITNPQLYEMVCRQSPNFISQNNLLFYLYVFKYFKGSIDISTSSMNRYLNRINDRIYDSRQTGNYLTFTNEEIAIGEKRCAELGVSQDFVCIFSRDNAFVASSLQTDINAWQHNDYRDAHIETFAQATDYLHTKSIVAVRMGKIVKDKCTLKNCIDYANIAYDGFMDLYLMKHCRFYLGSVSGICIIAMLFNKPCAFVNVIPAFNICMGSHPQNRNNLYIFKKYFSNIEQRFLSLQEMIDFDASYDGRSPLYKENGIDLIDNSGDEILALATEMNSRLEGVWIESAIEKERQQRYQEFVADRLQYNQIDLNTVLYGNVGADFLHRNWAILFPEQMSYKEAE